MKVIATFWHNGSPVYILENSDVMAQNGEKHASLTADVSYGYNGSYGYNVSVSENGIKISQFTVGA